MVYKNDASKLRLAVRNYLVRMIGICSFAIAFNIILFFIVLPAVRPEMKDIQPVLSVAFLFVTVYCGVIIFVFCKKLRKNFADYSFQIDENRMVVHENNMTKEYAIADVSKIKILKKNKYLILMNNASRIYTSPFLEMQDEFEDALARIRMPEKGRSEKILNALSWFFVIGFLISRFIPNIWVYLFFSIGFVGISLVSIYMRLHMNIKPWVKAYVIIFYLFFDLLIVKSLLSVFKIM